MDAASACFSIVQILQRSRLDVGWPDGSLDQVGTSVLSALLPGSLSAWDERCLIVCIPSLVEIGEERIVVLNGDRVVLVGMTPRSPSSIPSRLAKSCQHDP